MYLLKYLLTYFYTVGWFVSYSCPIMVVPIKDIVGIPVSVESRERIFKCFLSTDPRYFFLYLKM